MWELLFMKLPMVETINKQAKGTSKSMRATREAARTSCQTSKIVAQLSVASFNRVGIGFSLRELISSQVIPETVISVKGITVVALGLRSMIYHVLNDLLRTFPGHFPT
jgi:hypothetical protein